MCNFSGLLHKPWISPSSFLFESLIEGLLQKDLYALRPPFNVPDLRFYMISFPFLHMVCSEK